MNRLIICCSLALSMAGTSSFAQTNASGDTKRSCGQVVQSFYDWYVPKALKEHEMPALDFALKYKASLFSPDLLQALREDSRAQAKAQGEIVGLDFDPFLNTQDPHRSYALGKITFNGDRCWVEVHGVSSGKKLPKPDVVAELMLRSGQWSFVNFHYGKSKHSEDENLVSILKRLQQDRQQHRK